MTDAQQTRTPSSTDTEIRTEDMANRVNVYDNNSVDATTPPLERRTTYPTTPTTRSSPSLVTWLLILALILLAIYFGVQFLT